MTTSRKKPKGREPSQGGDKPDNPKVVDLKHSTDHKRGLPEGIIESFSKFLAPFFQAFADTIKIAEADAEIFAPQLEKARLWLPPSTSLGLVYEIKEALNADPTPPSVERAFINYFQRNDWQTLHEMVDGWMEDPRFEIRKTIINDALEAHIQGKYTLSIPALLPLIEGILCDEEKISGGDPTKIINKAFREKLPGTFSESSRNILLRLLTSPALYGGIKKGKFQPEIYEAWLVENGENLDQVMNRHAIFHGVQVNYSSIQNSIRVFMLLDAVHWIIGYKFIMGEI